MSKKPLLTGINIVIFYVFHLQNIVGHLTSYLAKILETQPCDTRNCLEMSHGRIPSWANSTILSLTPLGSGRPFTNTPPS